MTRKNAAIIRRRCNIPFETAKVPGWIESEKDIEAVLNTISFVLPPGEKFFIQSVQHYQDRISDPVLKEQVRLFSYQEAMHSKEHARANAVVARTFKDGPELERIFTESLERVKRKWSRPSQLAFTCALEHFTAIVSHNLLRWQKPFIDKSDPSFAAMWLWHAVEEAEHKAVCFDVYQQVCGRGPKGYLRRVGVMFLVSVLLVYSVFVSRRMLQARRLSDSEAETKRLYSAAVEPAPIPQRRPRKGLWQTLAGIVPTKLYFDYYKPSFHPWDTDDTPFIEEWKERYRSYAAIVDANADPQQSSARA